MSRYDLHVCLVSDQTLPNILPVLDSRFKPKALHLLVSSDMTQAAEAIRAVVQPLGVKVSQSTLQSAYDVPSLHEDITNCLIQLDGHNLALNLTGGTKLMAIAAQQVFEANDKPIFYINQQTDQLLSIAPDMQKAPEQLSTDIKLKAFLQAYGSEVLAQQELHFPPERQQITEQLIRDIEYFESALGLLNTLAQSAERSLRSEVLNRSQQDNQSLQDLLDRLEQAKLLRQQQGRLVFSDEDARFFANGGWLEWHVHRELCALKAECGIQDMALGLQLQHGNSKNELDVAILARNSLYIVECKTRNFKQNDSASDAIYKLHSLSKLGGLRTTGILISYRRLNDADKRRAKALGIKTIAGLELQRLREKLREFLLKSKTSNA